MAPGETEGKAAQQRVPPAHVVSQFITAELAVILRDALDAFNECWVNT